MILRRILVAIAGTVIEFCTTICAVDKSGENTCFPVFVGLRLFSRNACTRFPLSPLNNRRLRIFKYPSVFFGFFYPLLNLRDFV